MASNELPRPENKLWPLAPDMSDGLETYEASIDVKQNIKATLDTNRKAADDQKAYEKARQAESEATTARDIADPAGDSPKISAAEIKLDELFSSFAVSPKLYPA